jgi:hypothetical protein
VQTADEFFAETEHAVRHLFKGLEYYTQLVNTLTSPSRASNKTHVERYVAHYERYFALDKSRAALCGAVLEIAYAALNAFPRNDQIPASCSPFVSPGNRAVRFCFGREIHGLPMGLLIYAGRNQHVHWEDASFDKATTAVFDTLLQAYLDTDFDMAYVLNSPRQRSSKAHHVVQNELKWWGYDQYIGDLKSLVEPGATA